MTGPEINIEEISKKAEEKWYKDLDIIFGPGEASRDTKETPGKEAHTEEPKKMK